ncbi:cysteine desulfurase family protein [Synechococcus elongatus]|uniref:cysteine desulfurase n=2 Tax=Synechococcus elongatus TaxID=32046 RepID=Q31K31_SYNE7|nr:cysteine desulfurase family protein [Synechococcus elongatus]ABB58588.1 cysteine desulfurase NifS [Synechococcus elongatus PCC 7942 = FACHB-805]AJD56959.1 cysteine desulfurase [Synechococcus elongatus UTEX 2973]MBD2587308.1 cysteine desulfurase [Synechococcus elongatus FACHB-242]MBD2688377.1 cysteine desulfurase [Synechococcus elongatus FACHB-1061]MBD2705911.1 cysteine desulfurase [Synechococcus elongatus PCC 7942 = FACHB-805]
MSKDPIYLDYHATTPVDSRVVTAMQPFWGEQFGNPASRSHRYGLEAAAAVQVARETLATAIAAQPEELIFCSGATEANNLAIKGVAETQHRKGQHLITVATEHQAVLSPCRYLESLGFQLTVLPVNSQGLISVEQVAAALRPDTILVSVMAANNEIGVLQPIAAIGALCRDRGVVFHCDAAQALGRIPFNVSDLNVDLLSLSGHKVYGPKGIGLLYRRSGVAIAPQLHGGSQEQGLRAGTLAPALIVGFAQATELAIAEQPTETLRLQTLRDRLWQGLQAIGGLHLNGDPQQRLPSNLNFSIEGIDPSRLIQRIRGAIAVSSGSACSSGNAEPSHVLTAIGRSPDLAHASLRIGLGRFTIAEEIDRTLEILIAAIQAERSRLTRHKKG